MKRNIRSFVVLVIIVAMLIVPVSADGDVAPAASAYFSSYTAYTEIENSGGRVLTIGFDVASVGSVAKLGATRILVMKSSNRTDWTTVATYYSDDYPSMICNNDTVFHVYERSYTASYNYYYKIYVSFYAYKSTNNHGTLHAYSNTVYVSR